MDKWFKYAGNQLVRFLKWVTLISATVSGVWAIISDFYVIPFADVIVPLGTCIAAVAMFVVGNAHTDEAYEGELIVNQDNVELIITDPEPNNDENSSNKLTVEIDISEDKYDHTKIETGKHHHYVK